MATFPTRNLQHRTAVRASLAAAVFLVACSSSPDDAGNSPPRSAASPPSAASGSTVPPGTVTSSPASSGAAPSSTGSDGAASTSIVEATEPESPLGQYVSGAAFRGGDDFDPAKAERETRAHEEAIARCMADEGFDYEPYVQPFQWSMAGSGVAIITAGSNALPDLPPDQFAAQYGYGLSTRPPRAADDIDVDPNAAIVDAMSLAERVAYYRALLGADQSLDDQGRPNAEMPGDPESCWEQASTEVWGDQQASPQTDPVLAAFASLLEQIAAIEGQVAADPRMVAAKSAWSDCMADAGFPGYTDLNAPQSDVATRARDVMGAAMDPANADPDELADLQRFEIATATADERCREGYGDTYSRVRFELETRFVEQHRNELEQYRDAVAAQAG